MAIFGGKGQGTKYAFACTIIASIISILMGYEFKVELLAGILNYCALEGSLTAGRLSDHIGRCRTIVVGSVIFVLGSLLMGFAPNYATLVSSRCVVGIAVRFALVIAPVYSAELAPATRRGFLTSLPELCISTGILLGYMANIAFANLRLRHGRRLMLGVCAIPAAALAFGALAMPESPRWWLAMQGRVEEARGVMVRVSSSEEEAERRLEGIIAAAAVPDGDGSKGEGVWKELVLRPKPAVRRILVAALGLHFLQHATGVEAIILYSPRVFDVFQKI